jgi:hypothetical protein
MEDPSRQNYDVSAGLFIDNHVAIRGILSKISTFPPDERGKKKSHAFGGIWSILVLRKKLFFC